MSAPPSSAEITVVIFRKDRTKEGGNVFALFPHLNFGNGYCTSYQHSGQHSAADYQGCVARSRPATPEEYASLKAELERIGYVLQIRERAISQ